MLKDFSWKVFEKTGDVKYYLNYRDFQKSDGIKGRTQGQQDRNRFDG